MVPLRKNLVDQFHLWDPKLMWLFMQLIQVDFALKFDYIDVTTIVCIQVHRKHVGLISREVDP